MSATYYYYEGNSSEENDIDVNVSHSEMFKKHITRKRSVDGWVFVDLVGALSNGKSRKFERSASRMIK